MSKAREDEERYMPVYGIKIRKTNFNDSFSYT